MNADELAEKLLDCLGSEDRLEIRSKAAQMLRQQQAEISDKKLVNDTFADLIKKQEKKIDEQQSEIEALKKELALWRLSKSSEEIEATESDKFCDTHCVWTDHHPECKHAKYRR